MKSLKLKDCTVLESSNCIFVDVDDTLIMWDHKKHSQRNTISVEDPHMVGHIIQFIPHRTHINILKRNHAQGRVVIVWSAAGFEWASTIVKTLGLEEYVSLIMEKPTKIMDDLPMDRWNPTRIYIERDIEGEGT